MMPLLMSPLNITSDLMELISELTGSEGGEAAGMFLFLSQSQTCALYRLLSLIFESVSELISELFTC